MRSIFTNLLAVIFSINSVNALAADEIIAKLGTTELRQSQIKAIVDSLDAPTQKLLRSDPAQFTQMVKTEVIRRAILKEASDKQWDKRPEIKSQLELARNQVIVTSYMNDAARPPANYPSEEEVTQAYEANKPAFAIPAQYRIAQIYLSLLEDKKANPQEVEKKANELANKAKTVNFAELAAKNSEHKESVAKGGDIGWLAESEMISELREQVLKLSVGQVSKPIKSQSGWHIVKLLEVKPASTQALKDAKEEIVSSLRLQKAKQLERQYIENILKTQSLSINEIAVGELIK